METMPIEQVLKMVEGFTPPAVTVRIKKVHPRKEGTNNNGPWSFQNIEVDGGKLKLKGLPEFPKAREGQVVTLRANQSQQHGLTGIKVNHEEYNGNTYHQLVITNSCKWEWGPGSTNGSGVQQPSHTATELSIEGYTAHLLSCTALTNHLTGLMGIVDENAIQACFATICIDTKNRGIVLPQILPNLISSEQTSGSNDDLFPDNPAGKVEPNEFGDDDIPF